MTDTIKERPPLDELGLPPMELAESNERNSRFMYRCLYTTLQKTFMLLFVVTFSFGAYILLLEIFNNTDNSHITEMIIVRGQNDSLNITLDQNDMKIIFLFTNSTINKSRKKRNTDQVHEKHVNLEHLQEEDFEKIKDIISQHRTLCHEKVHANNCQELITKLRSIIERNESLPSNPVISNKGTKRHVPKHPKEASVENFGIKPQSKMRVFNIPPSMPLDMHPEHAARHIPPGVAPITDTCLLAKLLKQNYPHVHGIYDPPTPAFMDPQIEQPSGHMRYFQPNPYLQSREKETQRHKLHPQDVDIFMSFLTEKPDHKPHNATSTDRTAKCPAGTLPCDTSDVCVNEKQWCDISVDCPDASDEVHCSCKSRVDSSRLCDGYFDCPFGEDEMGCFGCSENSFSCDDINLQSGSTCFTKEQRCNNEVDCPNHKDEIECNMLAPTLHKKPLFAISSTEGYLHRNFKGDWYAVCQNPYMWAHDACRRETGLIIRAPFIQIVPIDPLIKVNYLNTGPGGSIQPSDTCFNSSAVYVTCPDFLCGTRVSTTSQLLLRENSAVESHLYGRNKRFLLPGHPYGPYRMMYYGNRMKRDTSATDSEETDESVDSDNSSDAIKDQREKRADSRVVGGKPSQPAAWPWVVAIYRNGMFHCGGVVLTQNWIISAAHCVHEFWEHYYEIQVGMLRRFSFSPQEHNHRVSHVIVNRHYSHVDMKDDLSLLRVEPAIQFSRWVRPICLPGHNTAGSDWVWGPAPGTTCTAVGWGATIEHGPDPDHLREVEVPIWEQCNHREDREGREICAGLAEGGKDACQGDSGGPLLCRNPLNSQQWYLAGIVSHGDGCARKGEPGVYTRVSLFTKWIKYHTTSNSLPLVQPLQQCPGFKCKSGISKCIPITRKCDKIIDCLDAEDEKNCDFTDMRSVNSNLSETRHEIDINKSSEKRESVVSSVSLKENFHHVTDINLDTTTEQITTEAFTSTVTIIPTTPADIYNLPIKSVIDEKTPDFEHASTLEISPSASFEESDSGSTEAYTEDAVTTIKDGTRPTHGDIEESFSITFKPKSLESRSFVLEEIRTDIENSTNPTITTTETFDNEFESSNVNIHAFHETTSTNPNTQESTISDIETVTEPEAHENKSEQFVIELLKHSNEIDSSVAHVTSNKNQETNEESASESDSNSSFAKNLPDLENKNDIINKIEDMVFSELQPANIRRKHLVPKQFECRRIFQMISQSQRCDHKADCEDGTDELGCTCTDYLSTYDVNLLCDGVFDCSEGQDEADCYSCPDQHFLCKRSEICLPLNYVCDGKQQCPLGEDELNCYALTNGKEMFYDIDEKPKNNLEGYVTKRNKDDWQVVCEDNLSVDEQEQAATHICHYLGYSAANRYSVKYINVKEEDIVRASLINTRTKRNANEGKPIHFTYKSNAETNEFARNIVIKEPQLLKEECVPNVTKTCKSLYVYCDRSLYTNFDFPQDIIFNRAVELLQDSTTHLWPWVAKVFVEGNYKCTGILIDASWVIASNACLWDTSLATNLISVILGSHRTIHSVGTFEKIHKVDAAKELYNSRVILFHLKIPVEISNKVKPMVVSAPFHADNKTVCVAVGQDNKNTTIHVFLNETTKHCKLGNLCYIRRDKENICTVGEKTKRQWAGLISCHNDQGWFPVASFVDSRGECGLGDTINATHIDNLRQELRHYSGKPISSETLDRLDNDNCEGVRCSRGRCVSLREMCDGVQNCEDGNDESEDSCRKKIDVCDHDPYLNGCDCSLGQIKCRNGKCVSKELFGDGTDDCGDGTDEPLKTSCAQYLVGAMPSRLCDGVLHCQDRSDEDPLFCKCFAKHTFKCGPKNSEVSHCVAPDMVCDGVRDCPNGEDERTCVGLSAPRGTLYGVGQVMVRSHGVWRSKCYPSQQHTKSELEAICRELGFLSGHAKEMKEMEFSINTPNSIAIEPFSEVQLNNQTVIRMRNTNEPIAKAVFDPDLKKCYPVFIECM